MRAKRNPANSGTDTKRPSGQAHAKTKTPVNAALFGLRPFKIPIGTDPGPRSWSQKNHIHKITVWKKSRNVAFCLLPVHLRSHELRTRGLGWRHNKKAAAEHTTQQHITDAHNLAHSTHWKPTLKAQSCSLCCLTKIEGTVTVEPTVFFGSHSIIMLPPALTETSAAPSKKE